MILGFVAQALFGARSVVQWYLTEKTGKVVSPKLFWVFSLCGSSLFLTYGLIRADAVILIGQTISFYIYVRNLHLKHAWVSLPLVARVLILAIPPIIVFLWIKNNGSLLPTGTLHPLVLLGIVGQLLLNCRYLYQWYFSEKAHESILPLGFWAISALASLFVVAYALFTPDPVLLVAQALGLLVYARNIIIYLRRGLDHHSVK